MEISRNYTPGEIEEHWSKAWDDARVFRSVPDQRPAYTITIPPPNVTGILHMGHILNNTIQDILIRRKRMEGYNALWVPGTDHASIATEAKVVQLLAQQGIRKQDISREAFLEHAFAWKEKYGGIILKQLRKLGASCDWERTAFTMDAEYSESVIQVFCELFDKGLIYRGVRMVNWDPQAQTAVSDEEVIYKETQGNFYHLRYEIEGQPGQFLVVATTRPETILGDTAVAVHPEDSRYAHLHGAHVIVPLVNRRVPIIADEYVDREFGTGCLKVTPAHDLNDYEIGIRHNLPVIDALNPDGTISEAGGGLYVGMDRFAVRKKIADDLEAAGLLEKKEPHKHSVGYSERTSAAIEPRLSLQWFLKMEDISRPALDAVVNGEVNLIPGRFENTYKHWMENVRDWCLSRQLWWGHRIPAYYIQGTNDFVVAPNEAEALEKARIKTGNPALSAADLSQESDVLDTWASSWLWPISVFNGITRPGNEEFRYYYPTNDLVTAPEILFFWVARMIIAGYAFTGQKPFTNVYLTGIVRDDKRRKMSKSLGNSPDPLDLITQYGADGVRVGMLFASAAGNDLLYKEQLIEQGRNFANKIWNAFRLVKGWTTDERSLSAREAVSLEWMEARMEQVSRELVEDFAKFRISESLMTVYKLIWDDFCSWFLEMIKPDFGQPLSAEALDRSISLFEDLLHLLHPFMPFITEELWHNLREREAGAFLCTSQLPDSQGDDKAILSDMEVVKEAIVAVRAFRAEKGLSPKDAFSLAIKSDAPAAFEKGAPVMEKLLNLTDIRFVSEKPEGTGSIRVGAHELYIPQPQIDVEAERGKILKEIEYTEGFLASVNKKLDNENFVKNAKEAVIEAERKKRADAEAKLEVLRKSLAELGE
ncbi:MAG: valine--tRNA ligase [Bacteroidetes bacterium]|nr:MAG: valine--tRNA ligase [Bacteroidota bacterium]